MARITLDTWTAFGVRYQHPNERPGATTLIPTYHVVMPAYVAPADSSANWRPGEVVEHGRTFEAILDTGAPLTIIPHDFWRAFAGDVHIMAQPAGDAAFQIAGGSQSGQLGRVRLRALDDAGNWMPADWTVALFLDPPTPTANRLDVPLIGLNAHFFSRRRRLRHVGSYEDENFADVPEWRLEDRSRLLPW